MTTLKPDGDYVMVPMEPTDAMLEAGIGAFAADAAFAGGSVGDSARALYRAMLAAAPPTREALEEALKPFARRADSFLDDWADGYVISYGMEANITVGDFRRAREALRPHSGRRSDDAAR